VLSSLRDWVRGLFETDDRVQYDQRHLEELNYTNIETAVAVDGETYIRCNLCAQLFDEMADCVDHVASHNDDVGQHVDPFDKPLPSDDVDVADIEGLHRARGQDEAAERVSEVEA
jgi:hypothetical protein